MTGDSVRQAIMSAGHAAPISGRYNGPEPTVLAEDQWPWDLADAVFFHRALEQLMGQGEAEAGQADVQRAFQEVLFALQRRDLEAFGLTTAGIRWPALPDLWGVQSHVADVICTGGYRVRNGIGQYVPVVAYVTRDSLQRFQDRAGQPVVDNPWLPLADENMKAWTARGEVRAEARRRARQANLNPGQRADAHALTAMWHEAGRGVSKWETFEQYLNDLKQREAAE